MIKRRLLFFTFLLMVSCLPNEAEFEGFRRVELIRLLSNDQQKSWVLESRVREGEPVGLEDCENPKRLVFKFTANTTSKDSLYYINPQPGCETVADTLKGFWFIPELQNSFNPTDTLVFVWESTDTGYFSVNEINPAFFEIQSLFPADSLTEQFASEVPDAVDSLQSRKF